MNATFALLPERIFVGNRRWVEGKAIVVRDGLIASIIQPARLNPRQKIIELPGMALLPGFVNAHTHLEYTDASFAKPRRPGFVAWLDAISQWKQSRAAGAAAESLQRGVEECLAHGTVAVGDHYSDVAALPWPLLQSPLKGVVFHEVISLNDALATSKIAGMKKLARKFPRGAMRFGLAPHAPYSVSRSLLRAIMAWAKTEKLPLSMHIGESVEEGRGGALSHWIMKKSGHYPPSMGVRDIFEYLDGHGVFSTKMLAVHMNTTREKDFDFLPRARVHVVTCPNSRAYFHHETFALEIFLQKGYCVAMGTDSMASNHALNMFDELRQARKRYPRVPLETLWEMATVNGAAALDLPRSGKIQPGYAADFFAIPASKTRHPLGEALSHRGKVACLWAQGKVVCGSANC